jgi:hypothetical protein
MGIQIDPNLDVGGWNQMMFHVEKVGVGWVKVQANWSYLQPNRPDDFGQEFGLFQLHVQEAKRRGFKVLISIAKAPNWARSNQAESGPPDDPQLLGNFITLLLSKVGDTIDAIEVWNEPNLRREWTGPLPFSGAGYMQLFGPAYGAVRGYSPNILLVTAGLAPTQGEGAIDDREYLQQMYRAGLGQYQDIAIGVHPYGWGNPQMRAAVTPSMARAGTTTSGSSSWTQSGTTARSWSATAMLASNSGQPNSAGRRGTVCRDSILQATTG